MRQLTADRLTALRTSHEPPCISLYQPTHRAHPDNLQDPIRYRNLARDMETSLKEKYTARDVAALMEKYRALERDEEFWNHRTDGLAILSSPETFEIFELQRPVQELLVVASNFYTKPLVRALQSADRYQILSLTRNEARLFEGNRDALDPIDLSDIPSTATEVLGDERTAPRVSVRSVPGGGSFYHGGGGAKDETDLDRDRFFRAIDRAILENHSRPSGLPLLLAALRENQAPFRAVSHNPFLLANGIQAEPASLDLDQLRVLAWQQVEPGYLKRLAGLLERYHSARSRQMASDDISQVAEATVAGRVGTLLVEADRQIPGRLDEATGRIERGDPTHPEIGDILNDLAETVSRMKGDVVVVPAERMPSTTGLAATYRF
jgi:Bacterial archaeo-eukaryotic release factor family 3